MGTIVVGLLLALLVFALGFAVHFLWIGAALFVVIWLAAMAPWARTSDDRSEAPAQGTPAPAEPGEAG
jgi:hypothetical protein